MNSKVSLFHQHSDEHREKWCRHLCCLLNYRECNKTLDFAADFCTIFDFVSLNHFFFSSFLTRVATAARSMSEQICQAWVMMPPDEMRIFVIWSLRHHLSLRFLLPFIISQVAGWNVSLCWGNHPMMQCREERAVFIKQHVCVCGVNVWMCQNISKVLLLSWLRPLPNLRKLTVQQW